MKTIILIVAILLTFISVVEITEYMQRYTKKISILPVITIFAWVAYIIIKFNIITV